MKYILPGLCEIPIQAEVHHLFSTTHDSWHYKTWKPQGCPQNYPRIVPQINCVDRVDIMKIFFLLHTDRLISVVEV